MSFGGELFGAPLGAPETNVNAVAYTQGQKFISDGYISDGYLETPVFISVAAPVAVATNSIRVSASQITIAAPTASVSIPAIAHTQGNEQYIADGFLGDGYFEEPQLITVSAPVAVAGIRARAFPQADSIYAEIDYVEPDYFDDFLKLISISSPITIVIQSVSVDITDLGSVVVSALEIATTANALIEISDLPQVSASEAVADAEGAANAAVDIPSVTLSSAEASASGQAEATFGALLVSATAPTVTANGTATVSVASGTVTISTPDGSASGVASSIVSPSFNIVITVPSASATGGAASSVTIPQVIVIKPSVYELATEFPNTLPNVIISAPVVGASGDAATSADSGTITISAPESATTIIENRITNVVTGENYIRAGFHTVGYFAEETATVSTVTPTFNLIANALSEIVAPQVNITSLDGIAESSSNVSIDLPSISVSAPEPEEAITETPGALPQVTVTAPEASIVGGTGITVSPLGAILYVEDDYVDAGYTDDPIQIRIERPEGVGRIPALALADNAVVSIISPAASASVSVTVQPVSLIPLSIISPQPFEIVGEFPLNLPPASVTPPESAATGFGNALASAPSSTIVNPDALASGTVLVETDAPSVSVIRPIPDLVTNSGSVVAPDFEIVLTASSAEASGDATGFASLPEIIVAAPTVFEISTEFPNALPSVVVTSPEATPKLNTAIELTQVLITAPEANVEVSEAPLSLPSVIVNAPLANVSAGIGATASPLGGVLYVDEDYVDFGYTLDPIEIAIETLLGVARVPAIAQSGNGAVVTTPPSAFVSIGKTVQPVSLIPISVIPPQPFEIIGEFPLATPATTIVAPQSVVLAGCTVEADNASVIVVPPEVAVSIVENRIVEIPTGENYISSGFLAVEYFKEETSTIQIINPLVDIVLGELVELELPQVRVQPAEAQGQGQASVTAQVTLPEIIISPPEANELVDEIPGALPVINVTPPLASVEASVDAVATPLGAILYVDNDYVDKGYTDDPIQLDVLRAESEASVSVSASIELPSVNISHPEQSIQANSVISPISLLPVSIISPQPFETVGEFPLAVNAISIESPAADAIGSAVTNTSLEGVSATPATSVATGLASVSAEITQINVLPPTPFIRIGATSSPLPLTNVFAPIVTATGDAQANVNNGAINLSAPQVTGRGEANVDVIINQASITSPNVQVIVNDSVDVSLGVITSSAPEATATVSATASASFPEISVSAPVLRRDATAIVDALGGVSVSAPVGTNGASVQANASLPEQQVSPPVAVGFEFDVDGLSNDRQVDIEKEYRITFVPSENRVVDIEEEVRLTDVFPRGD